MISATVSAILLLLICPISCFPQTASGQNGKQLWVLQTPSEIVEYDPTTYERKRSVEVPPEALQRPDWLLVSSAGRIVFDLDPGLIEYAGPGTVGGSVWLWNGQEAVSVERGWIRTLTTAGTSHSVTEIAPRCFPSAGGEELYWFGNESDKVVDPTVGIEYSVSNVFRGWRSGPTGEARQPIVEMTFPPCGCGTGVCEETCPEAVFWVPPGGLRDFFLVTQWIPGQLGATYLSSYVYRRSGEEWFVRQLPQPLERVLDADQGGNLVVHAVADAGCCGWDNESTDLTLLTTDGRTEVLFDERARYANVNYDVSFFTSNAVLSPDAEMVAMTIVATAKAEAEVRLSSAGAASAAELGRILGAMADLPAVEVLSITGVVQQVTRIPRATLIGWLDDTEILIAQDQALGAVDIGSGHRRMSRIRVRQASHVFLR